MLKSLKEAYKAVMIRFRHAADIALITMRLYDSREKGERTTEARIGWTIDAVLYFQHIDGGITLGPDLIAQEAMPDVAVHERVFLVFDTLMAVPALMLESITMTIPRTGQIHVKKATVHTAMLCKIVNAVFLAYEWPPNMTKDDQLTAAIMGMSMEQTTIASRTRRPPALRAMQPGSCTRRR